MSIFFVSVPLKGIIFDVEVLKSISKSFKNTFEAIQFLDTAILKSISNVFEKSFKEVHLKLGGSKSINRLLEKYLLRIPYEPNL